MLEDSTAPKAEDAIRPEQVIDKLKAATQASQSTPTRRRTFSKRNDNIDYILTGRSKNGRRVGRPPTSEATE